MKLSEAIRLGAMLKPQAFNSSGREGSCALRAAADASGLQDDLHSLLAYEGLKRRYPVLLRPVPACPVCWCWGTEDAHVLDIVWHLNDSHRWTRERIADWVATVEPAEPSEIVESPVTDPAVSAQVVGS